MTADELQADPELPAHCPLRGNSVTITPNTKVSAPASEVVGYIVKIAALAFAASLVWFKLQAIEAKIEALPPEKWRTKIDRNLEDIEDNTHEISKMDMKLDDALFELRILNEKNPMPP